jgi:hypothetical protein
MSSRPRSLVPVTYNTDGTCSLPGLISRPQHESSGVQFVVNSVGIWSDGLLGAGAYTWNIHSNLQEYLPQTVVGVKYNQLTK